MEIRTSPETGSRRGPLSTKGKPITWDLNAARDSGGFGRGSLGRNASTNPDSSRIYTALTEFDDFEDDAVFSEMVTGVAEAKESGFFAI